MYVPATWLAATFRVPPTATVAAPEERVPVPEGLLVNVPTVMLCDAPSLRVMLVGRVIVNDEVPVPVTLKEAAETVPVVAGKVTPPVLVRTPAVERTTVPAVVPTAMFPKFMSTDLAIAIGVMMVAEALAVAET